MSRNHLLHETTIAALAAGGAFLSLPAAANPEDWQINLTQGVTPMSHDIWDLHMAALWVCVALGIIVFGAMFIEIVRFRKSKGAVARHWHEKKWLEITWTVVPVLILIGLAAPATVLTKQLYDTANSQMTVKVTGYQWLWSYDYVSYDGKSLGALPTVWSRLATDSNDARQLDSGISPWSVVDKKTGYHDYLLDVTHPLVIPADVKVRLLITSDDVIHGFGVPDFGIKKAAIPGMINDVWVYVEKPGIYRGQCYVLCGADHSAMPVVVKVLPRAEFDQWLAAQKQKAAGAKPAASGEAAQAKAAPTALVTPENGKGVSAHSGQRVLKD